MTPEQYQRACELYDRVATLPVDERDAVLDRDCPDPFVRDMISGMLMSEPLAPTPEEFVTAALEALEQEIDGRADPVPQIPGYKVLEQLGKGGFGVVYEAMEESGLERRVAVKVLKPGMDSRMLLRRFEVERRTLSRLEHPGICRIYSAGTTRENTPYFVMELIRGEPVTAYCDNRLFDVNRRIELFLQVCDSVMYAHRRGVIHRDLKPSNILIVGPAEQPRAVVIDFGVARVIAAEREHQTITRAGQAIGTAAYMSPEQARGDTVDTRTDVYALGSVLFELLTGIDPFSHISSSKRASSHVSAPSPEDRPVITASSAVRAASFEIAERRGTTRTALLRHVRGDLDWILIKALDPNPDTRYGSVESLVADLRAHLAGHAVGARPPRFTYHLSKFVTRNVFGVCAAALLFIVLSAATGVSLVLLGFMLSAQRDARQAKEEAVQRADIAEATTRLLTEDMIRQLVPWHSRDGKSSADITIRDILDATARACQERYSDMPVTKAAVLHTIGAAYGNLGDHQRAIGLLEEAYMLRLQHLGPENKDTVSSQYLLLHASLTLFLIPEAEKASHELLSRAEAAFGHESEHVGEIHMMMAELQYRTRRVDLALASAKEAIRILGGRGEISSDIRSELTLYRVMRLKHGDTAEVGEMCRRAYTRAIQSLPETHPVRLATIKEYSFVLRAQKRYNEALPLARVNYETYLKAGGPEHTMTLDAAHWYAAALHDDGKIVEAEEMLSNTVQAMSDTLGSKAIRTRVAMGELVRIQIELGHPEKAVRNLDVLVKEGSEHARPSYLALRGLAHMQLENFTQAETDLLEAWGSDSATNIDKRDAAKRLATLYEQRLPDPEKAEQWRKSAAEFERISDEAGSSGMVR